MKSVEMDRLHIGRSPVIYRSLAQGTAILDEDIRQMCESTGFTKGQDDPSKTNPKDWGMFVPEEFSPQELARNRHLANYIERTPALPTDEDHSLSSTTVGPVEDERDVGLPHWWRKDPLNDPEQAASPARRKLINAMKAEEANEQLLARTRAEAESVGSVGLHDRRRLARRIPGMPPDATDLAVMSHMLARRARIVETTPQSNFLCSLWTVGSD
mmetsp:Transcript_30916/g.72623  ORF Transcript_30916/g.72623 Transcript_30916/m.72623 type:complete len:214 (+) Transcript_30916:103-744(+)